MDDTTTTDVILAAGPTVVALAALASAAWQQWRGFRHEREMTDLRDARELFDEAVLALLRADDARHRATQVVVTHGAWASERGARSQLNRCAGGGRPSAIPRTDGNPAWP